jgi:hypothetical protein
MAEIRPTSGRRVPRQLAQLNAAAIASGSLIRIVIGDKDETFPANREFHDLLEQLAVPHTWTVLPGVGHDPMAVLTAMGDGYWAFHRAAFAAAAMPQIQADGPVNPSALNPSSTSKVAPAASKPTDQ